MAYNRNKHDINTIFLRLSLGHIFPSILKKKFPMHLLYGPSDSLIQGIWTEISTEIKGKIVDEGDLISGTYQVGGASLFDAAPEVIFVPKASHLTWATSFINEIPQGYTVVLVGASAPPAMVRSEKIAVSPCYECSLEDSKMIAQRYARREGLSFAPQAFEMLAQWTREGQWAQACKNLKLCEESPISINTIEFLMNMPSEEKSTAILTGYLPHDLSSEDPLKTLRAWQRLMNQLWQFKVSLEKKMSVDQAIQELTPPLFFKHKPVLLAQHARWTMKNITQVLSTLLTQEVLLKQESSRSFAALYRILTEIRIFLK